MQALEGERRYSSYSFTISALDGGEWSASRPGRALPPGKEPPVPIVQEAGWAPEPVWTQRLQEKSFAPDGDRTPIARSFSQQSDTILPELTRLLYIYCTESYFANIGSIVTPYFYSYAHYIYIYIYNPIVIMVTAIRNSKISNSFYQSTKMTKLLSLLRCVVSYK
jgi:hypothetical protein